MAEPILCYKCQKPLLLKEPLCSGLHEECFQKWFKIKEPFRDLVAKSAVSTGAPFEQLNSSFFHGKFRKYSGRLGNTSYILKVEQADYPELPRCEYLCNQIAALLGLEVPPFYLIRFQDTLDAFVSKNFMQTVASGTLIHIYHFLGSRSFNCENLLRIIKEKTQRLQEVEKFVRLCLFDALIGNHDRHGRNLALIQTPKGFRLSPAYDNPSYLAIEIDTLLGAQHEPKGSIATKATNEPSLGDYIQEWQRLKQMQIIEDFKKQVTKQEKHIFQLVDSSFLSLKRKTALSSLIHRRLGELNEF